jgi:hypothetical protein
LEAKQESRRFKPWISNQQNKKMTNRMNQENSVIVFQPIIEIPIPKHFKLNIKIGGVVGRTIL